MVHSLNLSTLINGHPEMLHGDRLATLTDIFVLSGALQTPPKGGHCEQVLRSLYVMFLWMERGGAIKNSNKKHYNYIFRR